MKKFEFFVDEIVKQWRTEKKQLLESAGLGIPSNREIGDAAENYVLGKISKMSPKYKAVKSKGSQTPSDIYAVARRKGYWHIMLLQIKCSTDKDGIYQLNANDKKVFNELAKFVKKQISVSEFTKDYMDKPLVISAGFVGVWRNEKATPARHTIQKSMPFKIFNKKMAGFDGVEVMKKVNGAHSL